MRGACLWLLSSTLVVAACGNDRRPTRPDPLVEPDPTVTPSEERRTEAAVQDEEASTAGEPSADAIAEGVGEPEDRATLEVGDRFSCAVHERAVWCWGDGSKGQLGSGRSQPTRSGPVRVRDLESHVAVAVAAGSEHACALVEPGRAICWGTRGDRSAALPPELARRGDVAGIAAGGDRTCARLTTGDIVCVEPDASVVTQPLPGPIARAVQVGSFHACTRFADARVQCWGTNLRGGVGASGATDAVRLALGSTHTCVLRSDRSVRCWGDVHRDRREAPDYLSGEVQRGTDAVALFAGGLHTCFSLADGGARCVAVMQERVWPSGARGHAVLETIRLPNANAEVALGTSHRCVRALDGGISCWGNDDYGQSTARPGPDYLAEPVLVRF